MDKALPDILVRYLDGELSGAEKENFEQQLAENSELREELQSLQATREAIRLYGLRQKVSGIHSEMMKEMQPGAVIVPMRKRNLRYALAAAATLVLLIGGYFIYNVITLSPERVFASNYTTYELVTVRDGGSTETLIERAYREKRYNEVISIDASENPTPKAKFLCGAAALELNNLSKAIQCFNEVLAYNRGMSQPVLKDETEYYLALSYLRNKNYDKALALLQTIENDPAHTYRDKVTPKLIRQIKRLH